MTSPASTPSATEAVQVDAVLASLLQMAELAEAAVRRALYALCQLAEGEASRVFLGERRINEMEVSIDEQVVQVLLRGPVRETDLRLLMATTRITNDLERLGDQAVNVAERVISLCAHRPVLLPRELVAMAGAVENMVSDALQALFARRVNLAQRVLESDDRVDGYAETVGRLLVEKYRPNPSACPRPFNCCWPPARWSAWPTTPPTSPRM